MKFASPLLALFAAPAVVALVIPRSSIAPAAAPSITPAPERQTFTWTGDAKPTEYQKRCESENESCATMTAGPESAIAVTTTMLSTVLVPCTTTTTVSDSSTITTTYWSTEVMTQTISVQGEQTITVQIVTPAPQIGSSTFLQNQTMTFVTEEVATSFYTSYGSAQTVTSTGVNVFSTLSVAGSGAAASAVASSSVASVAPAVQTQSAWTATSASASQSTAIAGATATIPSSIKSASTVVAGTLATNSLASTKMTTISGTVVVSASVGVATGTAVGTATPTPVFSAGETTFGHSRVLLGFVLAISGYAAIL